MTISDIIGISIIWIFAGFFLSGFLLYDPKCSLSRTIFLILLWPIALSLRLIKFIIGIICCIYIGFVEEIKELFK